MGIEYTKYERVYKKIYKFNLVRAGRKFRLAARKAQNTQTFELSHNYKHKGAKLSKFPRTHLLASLWSTTRLRKWHK